MAEKDKTIALVIDAIVIVRSKGRGPPSMPRRNGLERIETELLPFTRQLLFVVDVMHGRKLDSVISLDNLWGKRENPQENLEECRQTFDVWPSYAMLKATFFEQVEETDRWKRRETPFKIIERDVRFIGKNLGEVIDMAIQFRDKINAQRPIKKV